jgi:hypothetical protein
VAKSITPPDKLLGGDSTNWKNWMSELSPTTCKDCVKLHGKIDCCDLYYNNENRLSPAPNRMWYEADFDYVSGERDGNRVFYSNDGLIFVSYDHGKTFYELTK